MSKIILPFLSLMSWIICLIPAAGQGWVASNVIKASVIDPQYSVIDNANNLYVLATFNDTIYAPYFTKAYSAQKDLFLFKFDASGNVLWHTRIGSTNAEVAGGIAVDDSSNCYVTGTYYAHCRFTPLDTILNTGNGDIFIAKYNSNGVFRWAKNVGSSASLQSSMDLKYDGNNHLMMTGFFKDQIIIGSDPSDKDTLIGNTFTSTFIAQFDMNGHHLWSKRYLSTNNLTRIRRIDVCEDGYYFGGYLQGTLTLDIGSISSYVANTYDGFLYKTDLTGTGQWYRRIRGSGTENFKSLGTDEYENVYVLGNFNSTALYVDSTASSTVTYNGNAGGYDTFLGKYNRSGVLQWFLRKGSTDKDLYSDFVVRNNIIYATGYFTTQIIFNNDTLKTSGSTNSDAFVAAFNEIGDPISGVSIVGTGNYEDAGTIVNMDASSRAYVSGYYKSQSIRIGNQTYTSNNINKSDLFLAIYRQRFTAVITDERMISCFGLEDGMLKATPYFGRPPYTYSWNHNPSLNNPVADNLPPGTYTVTITDANDSTAQVSHDILEPSPIGITGIVTPVSCLNGNDGAIDLSVTGGTIKSDYAYFWTTLNGSGVDPLSADQSGLSRGIYTVVVEDDNLCSDSAEFEVTQPAPFNYSGTLITQIIKPIPPGQTGSIDLHVSGGSSPYGYAWTGPDGFNATTEDIASLDTAGLYNLSLTDNKGCVSDTAFAVIDNFTFVAQIIAQTNVLCHNGNDGTATVSVFNAVKPCTYNWNDVGMLLDSVRTGMAAGNYTVIVTDAALHTALARVKITEPSADLSLILDPKDLRCYNDFSGVVDLNVAGGTLPYSFDWDNGFTGEDLVNVEAGNYNVRVTDANDCEATGNTSLSEPDPIVLDITLSGNIYCFEGNTVSATVNASGGFGTFSYLWDDPGNQITETAYDLEAGWYSVEVTDMNNCKQTASILITQPTALSVTASLYNPCPGSSDGAIIPTVTGGTPAYDYEWSNSVFERMNTDISAGTYELTVTDHNSCTLVQNFTLSDTDSVKISNVNLLQPSCANPTGGSITIEALGGTGIYEYSIDEGQHFTADSIFESLGSGSYLIIVHDEKDCASKQVSAVLEIPANCALVIYDAFSPNGDDKNPVWNIGNIESFPNCRVQIFNLWGIMVFASNGYGTPWDGTYKGKDLPSGTYYYIIDPGDGSSVITGSVNIVY